MSSPGLPSSPPPLSDGSMGFGPSGGSSMPRNHEHPFMANVSSKAQKMNARAVVIISLSSFVLFLLCIGVLYILLKFKKMARPSAAGPAVTFTKRSGKNIYDLFLFIFRLINLIEILRSVAVCYYV